MAGAYYIWILGAFFIGTLAVMALLIGLFYLGHLMEKKETGSTHGFMELPDELRRPPIPSTQESPPNYEDPKNSG